MNTANLSAVAAIIASASTVLAVAVPVIKEMIVKKSEQREREYVREIQMRRDMFNEYLCAASKLTVEGRTALSDYKAIANRIFPYCDKKSQELLSNISLNLDICEYEKNWKHCGAFEEAGKAVNRDDIDKDIEDTLLRMSAHFKSVLDAEQVRLFGKKCKLKCRILHKPKPKKSNKK